MANVKLLAKMLDIAFMSVWGLTVFDLVKAVSGSEVLLSIDGVIKTLMAGAGLVYFLIQIPHKMKMQRLDGEIKVEELEKIKRENDKKEQSCIKQNTSQ